ncbi:Solute carrier family 28 member 3 [Eumeta japonica]|uniref:Solute carrier family 28 member 3 n=1 Tax=Eumeta variegata TaxID=151549 RepID=A0A4C1XWX0_EUMVA|nr:Solute carrier family 28 member 3 [Eumeta japonica]
MRLKQVATFLSYGVDGAAFVFGDFLVHDEAVFAFSTLPVIFFFSMLVEILFFWGALQWFCLKLGYLLRAATATTVCESVIAVGNVFLGNTESALLIKPYVALLTESELHVVMASGFATVSGEGSVSSRHPVLGTILAAYIQFGAQPAHLVTASVMSAPAALCYSKLLLPEVKRSLTAVDNIQMFEGEDRSTLSAATRGATNGIALILNIIANLVAFVAFVAFVNGVLGYAGGLLGNPDLNLEWIFGKVFIPFAWLMGTPWEECEHVGVLIGLKTIVNEFVAYQRMGEMKLQGLLSPRGELVATYALCGFTNPASAGIMIGVLAAMAPAQRETLSKVSAKTTLNLRQIKAFAPRLSENRSSRR